MIIILETTQKIKDKKTRKTSEKTIFINIKKIKFYLLNHPLICPSIKTFC